MHRQFPIAVKARIWMVGTISPRVSFQETRAVASAVDAEFLIETIPLYEAQTGKKIPVLEPPQGGPLGDWFKAILEWLSSEEGRAFIAFLFSLFGLFI